MNNVWNKGLVELEVSDFGPIIEGRIKLRPLTVFIGPSNTGKSYMAILIYALHRFFSENDELTRFQHERWMYQLLESGELELSSTAIDTVMEWVQEEFGDIERREFLVDIRKKVRNRKSLVFANAVKDLMKSVFDKQGDALSRELRRCFGSDIGALVRKGRKSDTRIIVRQQRTSKADHFHPVLTFRPQEKELNAAVPEKIEMDMAHSRFHLELFLELAQALSGRRSSSKSRKRNLDEARLLVSTIGTLADLAHPYLFGGLSFPAFYLPADRTGVMHAHSVVVDARIESASMTGLRPTSPSPMLSGVLSDFLRQLIQLESSPARRSKSRVDLGAKIEKAILAGTVRVERAEISGYPRFIYKPEGWKDSLPLMNASSMVSELAPVVLYLRYLVRHDNVLIVEEPESHLHPAMQVEFIRQLASLVQSGIRVIITTHSEWVLEELANIVRRSEIPESKPLDVSQGGIALNPNQVGAWLFKPKRRPRGSIVKEICLDDTGLYPSGFDDVAATLHNEWSEITSRIGGVA